jgi:hypothetical protein
MLLKHSCHNVKSGPWKRQKASEIARRYDRVCEGGGESYYEGILKSSILWLTPFDTELWPAYAPNAGVSYSMNSRLGDSTPRIKDCNPVRRYVSSGMFIQIAFTVYLESNGIGSVFNL